MSKSPVILILGAGANIGQSVARTFASHGYKVALAARSLDEKASTDKQLNIKSDFSDANSIVDAFQKVHKTFGIPSVVVYNASAATFTPPEDPFVIPVADFQRDTTINITSAYVAAQQAVAGFAQLPASASRTFIYTGNGLNTTILPRFIDGGIGKSGAAHMIWAASAAYKDRGFQFYYADERTATGAPVYSNIDGEAAGKHYWELSDGTTQGPWLQTFVKDLGYKDFGPYNLK